jgi:hypothetical protein
MAEEEYCALSLARFTINRIFVRLPDIPAEALPPVSDLNNLAITIAVRAYLRSSFALVLKYVFHSAHHCAPSVRAFNWASAIFKT